MLKYWIWVRFDSDSIPIRIGFESGRIPAKTHTPRIDQPLDHRSPDDQNSHSTRTDHAWRSRRPTKSTHPPLMSQQSQVESTIYENDESITEPPLY